MAGYGVNGALRRLLPCASRWLLGGDVGGEGAGEASSSCAMCLRIIPSREVTSERPALELRAWRKSGGYRDSPSLCRKRSAVAASCRETLFKLAKKPCRDRRQGQQRWRHRGPNQKPCPRGWRR